MDITFGLTWMMWLGIGIVAALLGWKYINVGIGAGAAKLLKVVAVGAVLISSVAAGFWVTEDTTTPAGAVVSGQWDWVHSSGDTAGFSVANNTTVTGDRTLLITFAATGGGTLDEATVNIDYACSREDTSVADDVTTLEIISVGEVTNITTGLSYSVLAKNSAGDYDVALDDGTTTYQDMLSMNFPDDPSARADTLGVQLEINPSALDAMDSYDTVVIVISIDGVQDTISIMRQ